MKKEDLKTGMIVETRDGNRYIVILGLDFSNQSKDCLFSQNKSIALCNYNQNLICYIENDFDIVKVYNLIVSTISVKKSQLIWERKEPPQLTERERAYLKAYSYDYEWVAKDKDGYLFGYKNKPEKNNYKCWWFVENRDLKDKDIGYEILDFIKWEDEEPYNIKELLGEE